MPYGSMLPKRSPTPRSSNSPRTIAGPIIRTSATKMFVYLGYTFAATTLAASFDIGCVQGRRESSWLRYDSPWSEDPREPRCAHSVPYRRDHSCLVRAPDSEAQKPKPRFGYEAGLLGGLVATFKKSRRRPTLPHGLPCSTIGSEELNFRVRDGIGCGLFDITTGNLWASMRAHGLRRDAASDAFAMNPSACRVTRHSMRRVADSSRRARIATRCLP